MHSLLPESLVHLTLVLSVPVVIFTHLKQPFNTLTTSCCRFTRWFIILFIICWMIVTAKRIRCTVYTESISMHDDQWVYELDDDEQDDDDDDDDIDAIDDAGETVSSGTREARIVRWRFTDDLSYVATLCIERSTINWCSIVLHTRLTEQMKVHLFLTNGDNYSSWSHLLLHWFTQQWSSPFTHFHWRRDLSLSLTHTRESDAFTYNNRNTEATFMWTW